MKLNFFLLLLLILGAALFDVPRVSADENVEDEDIDVYDDEEDDTDDEEAEPEIYEEFDAEDDEDWVLGPSDAVTTAFIYSDDSLEIVAGKPVTVLLSLSNAGDTTFNITYVGAYLHSPFDLSYYIQNFTVKSIGAELVGSSQLSVEYTFTPDKQLEPLEFWLSGFIDYNDTEDGTYHRSIFTNGTIELVDVRDAFDLKGLTTYLIIIAFIGAIFYFAFTMSSKLTKKRRVVERGTTTKTGDADWTGQLYKQAATSTAVRRNNRRSRPKKN